MFSRRRSPGRPRPLPPRTARPVPMSGSCAGATCSITRRVAGSMSRVTIEGATPNTSSSASTGASTTVSRRLTSGSARCSRRPGRRWPPSTERCSVGALSSRPWTPRSQSSRRRRGTVLAFSGEGGIGKTRLLDELGARPTPPARWCWAGARRSSSASCRSASGRTRSPSTRSSSASTGSSGSSATSCPSWPRCCPRSGACPPGLQDERYRTHRAVRALLEALAQVSPSSRPRRPALGRRRVAGARRAPAAPPAARAGRARARVPPRARPAAAGHGAGHRRARRLGDRALARRALVRRRRDAARRRHPGPVRGEIYEAGGGNPFFLQQLARQHAAGRCGRRRARRRGRAARGRAVARAGGRRAERGGAAARAGRRGGGRPGRPRPAPRRAGRASVALEAPATTRRRALRRAARRRRLLPRCGDRRPAPLPVPPPARAPRDLRVRRRRLADRRAPARGADALAERGGSLAARAHHLERCARPGDDEALEVLIEAGRHAAARAPATAADRFGAALRLIPQTPETMPRRLELLVGLAQALAATGRLEAALEALDDGLALVGPELAPVRARLVAGCAMCENLLGRHAAAHARLLGALDELGEATWAAADLEVELAADALYDSDFAGVRSWAQRALATAQSIDARAVRRRRRGAGVLRRDRARADRRRAGAARGRRRAAGRARRRRAARPPGHRLLPRVRASSSASATTTRSATSAAASPSRARPGRASS